MQDLHRQNLFVSSLLKDQKMFSWSHVVLFSVILCYALSRSGFRDMHVYIFYFIQQGKQQYLRAAVCYFDILWTYFPLEKTTNKDAVPSGETKEITRKHSRMTA
jgi:hypothetical protein